MSDNSKIEWTDATWNPITGCTKVSEGCRHCYALTFAERFRGTPGHYFENGFDLTLRPDKLNQPLKWKRPRKIFVNSMSDLFHKDVPDQFIVDVLSVIAEASQHTFQLLTKRPERMMEIMNDPYMANNVWLQTSTGLSDQNPVWPLPNLWIGTSVEDQKAANERIHWLTKTKAVLRFLSCEPLLGPLDIKTHLSWLDLTTNKPLIEWVIVGGESGHGARPMDEEWVIDIRDQCFEYDVAFFFKQWGGVNKATAGRELDGQTWNGMPA